MEEEGRYVGLGGEEDRLTGVMSPEVDGRWTTVYQEEEEGAEEEEEEEEEDYDDELEEGDVGEDEEWEMRRSPVFSVDVDQQMRHRPVEVAAQVQLMPQLLEQDEQDIVNHLRVRGGAVVCCGDPLMMGIRMLEYEDA